MLRRALISSRYIVYIAILGTFIASLALMVYETLVTAAAVVDVVRHSEAQQVARVIENHQILGAGIDPQAASDFLHMENF